MRKIKKPTPIQWLWKEEAFDIIGKVKMGKPPSKFMRAKYPDLVYWEYKSDKNPSKKKKKVWGNLPDKPPIDFRYDSKIKKTDCCKIPKGWGHELVIVNNEKYCGKILVFKQGFSFSMHYHLIKQETWYVNKGSFLFTWIDTETGEKKQMDLNLGDVITIPIGQPHQLRAKEDSEIFEISTQHFDSDSYRIWKGD